MNENSCYYDSIRLFFFKIYYERKTIVFKIDSTNFVLIELRFDSFSNLFDLKGAC